MKVLVTGALGFIGTNLCEKLLDEGHFVIGIDNLSGRYPKKTYSDNSKIFAHKNAKLVKGDVLDKKNLFAIPGKGITHIVHLAARAGVRDSSTKPEEYFTTNILGTMNILDFAQKNGVKNVVLASTSSVYGKNRTPFRESMATTTPLSFYAASKAGMESAAFAYHNSRGSPSIIILRFFTVYGQRGRTDMSVYKFAHSIRNARPITVFGSGEQERDFTYVDDITCGIVSAMRKNAGFEVYNLGCSRKVTINYLIALLEKNLGKKAKLVRIAEKKEDAKETFADISKARAELSYSPKTPIEEGIRLFCEWYLQSAKKPAKKKPQKTF